MSRKIEVVDYNPEWKKLFKIEAKKIKNVLGKNCVEIHHIGSTSVKGLKAKPVIDIMTVVKDINLVDEQKTEFQELGYECLGENGIKGRRFYTKVDDNPTHHIHILEKGNKADIERHLAVRDYLRNHADVARKYAELKVQLADKFTYDNNGYCDGKDAFVKNLEKKALKWKKQEEYQGECIALGMCFGVGIGSALGTMFSNLSMGMCLGISIGMCLGLVVGSMKNKE